MSCPHCNDDEPPEGFVCSYCLGNGDCSDVHGDAVCEAAPHTPEQKAKAKKLVDGGNVFGAICEKCGSVIAGCDYPSDELAASEGDWDPCGTPAYKWVEVDEKIRKSGAFYFCEEHGDIPHFLEAIGFGEWGAYQPGPEGCWCDFPY